MGKFFGALITFALMWWRAILAVLLLVVCFYYPLGAWSTNEIDKTTDYNFVPPQNPLQSQSVEMMAYIIDREVNQKTWTPNLPFFFPVFPPR